MTDMLTIRELAILMPVIDAGIKATGVQVFAGGNGIHMQSALDKLQAMVAAATADTAPKKDETNG